MDSSRQTSADGERSGSDENHTPETVSAASSSSQHVATNWTKREREGAPEEARKCAKAPQRPDMLTSLDKQQRKVLAQLVKCVDAESSVVITNPLLKGALLRCLTPLGRPGVDRGAGGADSSRPTLASRLTGRGETADLGRRHVWQPRGGAPVSPPGGLQRLRTRARPAL